MPTAVAMPKVGFSMEQGTVISWLKSIGESVQQGEAVVLIETEKVECEVEAQASGRLVRILVQPGQNRPPGHLLGIIAGDGEDVDAFAKSFPADPSVPPGSVSPAEPMEVAPSQPMESEHGAKRISPRARKLAKELGMDLDRIPIQAGKRISEDDVRSFAEEQREKERNLPPVKRVRVEGIRRVIADRMLQASQTTAMVAMSITVDFQKANEFRNRLGQGIGLLDPVLKAVALELRVHPILNSAMCGDTIEIYQSINLGFAVALEEGLVVPVIRNADSKSLLEIKSEREKLAEWARSGKLRAEDLTGGTFTVSSLGIYGVSTFTPILNPPQSAILGVGALENVPAVIEGRIEIRPRLPLTLVFDHRVTDGAPAAVFLKAVKERLERCEIS
jgi:pyruvate dehydrogenase E2 component (dihydrolipoamide acetyltransferase)